MKKTTTKPSPPTEDPKPLVLSPLVLLITILAFLLLAWGIWWYFEWKIETLDHQLPP
ncbi:MAG: hypothetical protein KKG00_03360 [Bacteroidetes bacterium]|nr:hypothetical protein [Bacteroidota bacterium]